VTGAGGSRTAKTSQEKMEAPISKGSGEINTFTGYSSEMIFSKVFRDEAAKAPIEYSQ
jgi:hypothetical protein